MNCPESFSNSSTSPRLIVSAEGVIRSSSRRMILRAAGTRPATSSDADAIPDVTVTASIMIAMTVRPVAGRSWLSMSVLSM